MYLFLLSVGCLWVGFFLLFSVWWGGFLFSCRLVDWFWISFVCLFVW